MSWQPILQSEDARTASAIVDTIADALATWSVAAGGVANGTSGIALFFAYLFARTKDRRHAQCAERLLEDATDALDPNNGSLCNGFVGLAWALTHLSADILEPSAEDPCEDIDAVVADLSGGSAELLFGLSGAGVYALERGQRPLVEHIIAEIEAVAIERPEGLAWAMANDEAALNLGTAHGTPGVLGFLGAALERGWGGERARDLLDRGARWFLAQRRSGPGAQFAVKIGEGIEPMPSRLAWCYGEPGIAASLALAGRGAGRRDLVDVAVELGLHGARRPNHGVVDACLCHGDAGNAHIYNRLYQSTQNPELGDVARRWFRATLARYNGDDLEGYKWCNPLDGELRLVPGFLYGLAGVGLVLLAAISDREPAWDRWLGLS